MIKPINLNLAERLKNRRFRERFIATLARDEIAARIRELRQKRGFHTQTGFAKEAGMQQSAVSRIEQSDYSGWTFKTLLRVAVTLNARLRVTFEPLENMLTKVERSESAAQHQIDPMHFYEQASAVAITAWLEETAGIGLNTLDDEYEKPWAKGDDSEDIYPLENGVQ